MKKFVAKQVLILSISIFCLLALITSSSYASFSSSSTNVSRTVSSGSLTTTFTNGSSTLSIAPVPLTDEEGSSSTPYTFSITNNGSTDQYIRIDLKSSFKDLNALKYSIAIPVGNPLPCNPSVDEHEHECIIGDDNIDIYSGILKKGVTINIGVRVWMRSLTDTNVKGSLANVKINVHGHVLQEYRGLDEAIKEDNLVRNGPIPTNNYNPAEFIWDIKKTNVTNITTQLYAYYSSTYKIKDVGTGSIHQLQFELVNSFTSPRHNNLFTCDSEVKGDTCETLYFNESGANATYKYEFIKSYINDSGIYLNNGVYKFNSSEKNYLQLPQWGDKVVRILSIDEDGYLTLDDSSITMLNWYDLTVSGIGTKDNPYKIIEAWHS